MIKRDIVDPKGTLEYAVAVRSINAVSPSPDLGSHTAPPLFSTLDLKC